MSRRRRGNKYDNRSGKICITLIVLMMLAVMSVQIVKIYHKNQTYIAQEESLNEQLEAETERQEALKEREQYVNSRDYIEDVARSKLGLVYKNEIVFKENKK